MSDGGVPTKEGKAGGGGRRFAEERDRREDKKIRPHPASRHSDETPKSDFCGDGGIDAVMREDPDRSMKSTKLDDDVRSSPEYKKQYKQASADLRKDGILKALNPNISMTVE